MTRDKIDKIENQNNKKFDLISNLYKITSSTLNLNQLLNLIMDMTLNILNADVGNILLRDQTGNIHSNVVFGLSPDIMNKLKYKNSRLVDYILKIRDPVIIKDYDKKHDMPGSLYIKSILCAPLKARKDIIGAIFIINKNLNNKITNFNKSDLEYFNVIVNNIAFSIENAQLYEEVVNIKNFNSNIINSISNGVITTDLQGNISSINDSAKFILDLNTNYIHINKDIKTIIKNLNNHEKITRALNRKENLLNLESILRLKDGTKRTLNISISVLNNPNKQIIGFVISIDDITEKKVLENQVIRSEQLAALGELSAGIAHEIKNPLTSIKGFSQMLPNKLDNKEFLLKFSNIIKTEVERLNKIIEGLLQFARPKGKKFENHSINKIINTVIELMRFQLEKNDIKTIIKLLTMPEVYCDQNQIEQVFINIILNAIHAMPGSGKLTIRNKLLVRRSTENLFYEYIALYITDTGTGIPKKHQDKLFNPFFTTKSGGTGLGLSISFRIVSEHKGFIEIFSKVKEGTTFVVYLPTVNNW